MKKPPKILAVCAPLAGRLPMLDETSRTASSRGRPCEWGPVCLKLGRKVPRVDGALSTQPRAQTVPLVRNTSTSSMQSPPARAAERISSALATRRWSSKETRMRWVWLRGSIYWGPLVWGWFRVSKPLPLIQRSTFSPYQEDSCTHSFAGFGLRGSRKPRRTT